MHDDQSVWNFIFTFLFVGLVLISMGILYRLDRLPVSIELFDLSLIVLASFRMVRLFVYDKIMVWFRDLFVHKVTVEGDMGDSVTITQKRASGPLRTVSDLLSCPWCFGMWAAWMISFLYFLTPFAWYPILFVAIAGVATFLQLLSNMIGWRAEMLKLKTQELERE